MHWVLGIERQRSRESSRSNREASQTTGRMVAEQIAWAAIPFPAMQITRRIIDEKLACLDADLAVTDAHRRRDVFLVESQWSFETLLPDEDVRHTVNALATIALKYEIDLRGVDYDAC